MRGTIGSPRVAASILLSGLFVLLLMSRPATGASASEAAKVCLRGVVRTAEGVPLKGIAVACYYLSRPDWPSQYGTQTSGENGRYEFQVAAGFQYYVLAGERKTSTSAESPKYLAESGKDVEVADLVIRPFSTTVHGRVVQEDGRPAANLDYGYCSENCSPVERLKPPKTGAEGEFTIHLLPDEPFAFWVFVDRNVFHVWRRLDPGMSPLRLILRKGDFITLPEDWYVSDTHEAVARYMVYAEGGRIDFSLPDLDGRTVSFADLRAGGKAVVVSITGSWCGGCRLEAPYLVDFYKRYKEKGLEIVSIAFERKSNERPLEAVRSFRDEFGVNYTVLYGGPTEPAHVESVLHGLKCFAGYPTTVYIDRQGKVQSIQTGFWIHSEPHKKWQLNLMEAHIEAILARL